MLGLMFLKKQFSVAKLNDLIGIVFRKNDKTKCDTELNKKELLFQMLRLLFNLELI